MLDGRRRKLRVTIGILAALAVTSLVLVMVSWRDLLVRYHLWALRREPAAFVSFLDAPEGSVKDLALKAFVREPAGRHAVVSLFLDEVEQARRNPGELHTTGGSGDLLSLGFRRSPQRSLEDVDKAIVGFRGDVQGEWMFWGELRWVDMQQTGLFRCADNSYTVPLAKLMLECRGSSLELTRYPVLGVEVVPLEFALLEIREWGRSGWGFRGKFAPLLAPESPQDFALVISRVR